MPVEVRVPVLGESVVEATIGAWRKQPGDRVEAGEPLVELETDKVNVDVAAERSGVLERIERHEGDTVQPGDVIALLGDGAGAAPGGAAPSTEPAPSAPAEASVEPLRAQPEPARPSESAPPSTPTPARSDGAAATPPAHTGASGYGGTTTGAGPEATAPDAGDRPEASPMARRLADEFGIDLARVQGSGTGGRVTREDVERYLAERAGLGRGAPSADAAGAPAPPAATAAPDAPAAAPRPEPAPEARRPAPPPSADGAADPRGEERMRMSRRRQTIAQRLVQAQQTAAMLTTFNEVDMTAVGELRRARRDAFKERHGVGLGFMSFFTKAVVGALKAFPRLNGEIRGAEIVLKHYYDIGIAVGAEEGLVVPVVRDADRKSFAEIEREVTGFAERARANTLTLEDLRGGTFTITNGGVFGSLLSTPILSPPQVGILGMHRTQDRPVARDGQVVIRPMMYLALTYDHRMVDGREAVQFLVRVKELIEDPEALLLEG